jgi:hypothetical protein
MEIFLVPVSSDRYELYCEHQPDEADLSPEAPPGSGRIKSMMHRMKAAVARVEQENQAGVQPVPAEHHRWRDRMKQRALCWIAEKVAEQRLLWRIRKESDVTLVFPDDIGEDAALATARGMIQREADRHLRWTVIDGLLFAASGIVALVPGPNPLAYYFGFRFVGHVLSRRGAKHALNVVRWTCQPAAALTSLRHAIPLETPERNRHVQDAARVLHLQHLSTFFERTAIPAA